MKIYAKGHVKWMKKWTSVGKWIWRSRFVLLVAIIAMPASFMAGRNMGMRSQELFLMEGFESAIMISYLLSDHYLRRRREIRESHLGIGKILCECGSRFYEPSSEFEECACGTPKTVPSSYGECRNSTCTSKRYKKVQHLLMPTQYFSPSFFEAHLLREKDPKEAPKEVLRLKIV